MAPAFPLATDKYGNQHAGPVSSGETMNKSSAHNHASQPSNAVVLHSLITSLHGWGGLGDGSCLVAEFRGSRWSHFFGNQTQPGSPIPCSATPTLRFKLESNPNYD